MVETNRAPFWAAPFVETYKDNVERASDAAGIAHRLRNLVEKLLRHQVIGVNEDQGVAVCAPSAANFRTLADGMMTLSSTPRWFQYDLRLERLICKRAVRQAGYRA